LPAPLRRQLRFRPGRRQWYLRGLRTHGPAGDVLPRQSRSHRHSRGRRDLPFCTRGRTCHRHEEWIMKRRVVLSLMVSIVLLPILAILVIDLLTSSKASPVAIGPPAGPYRGSEPPGGIFVPEFALKSYRGDVVRTRSLRGKVVLVTFLD